MATGQRRARPHRIAATILAASIALTGCFFGGDDDDAEPDESTPTTQPDDPIEPEEPIVTVAGAGGTAIGGSTLGIVLNEGTAGQTTAATTEVVAGTPLSAEETAALIARLPDWNVSDADRTDFRLPVPTVLPPEADSVDASFPPEIAADPTDEPDLGALEVVRFQPQGVVDVAPFLAVTFNQPMVPLATLDQLDARDVPATIAPDVDGRWRWIGTRTLRFEVEPGLTDRLPAATEFTVEIPAGTTAQSGAVLDEAVSWTFRTPAPSVTSFANGNDESLPVSPVFVAVFDQLISPEAVLAVTTLTANGTDHPIRLATEAEIEADDRARRTAAAALDGRWLAFTPDGDLAPDADLVIAIGPGTPSAEGPLTSAAATEYTARTFGPFEIRDAGCSSSRCEPGEPYSIRFNNAIDPDAFEADMIEVQPAIPGLRIEVSGNTIWFAGTTAGRSNYSISIDGDLRDEFGQRLGGERTLDWVVGSADPGFVGFQRQRFTIDPAAETATVSVQSINHESLEVTAWSVTPNDLEAFDDFLDRVRRNELHSESEESGESESEESPWPVVLRETVSVDAEPDVWTESQIDLTSAFDLGGSQLVVLVETTEQYSENDDRYWRNRPSAAWVQRTTLGLDAFVDDSTLVIWTTDLLTGEPVDGVPVELLGDGRTATTDEAGLATLDLGENGVLGLWAAVGDRTAYSPADRSGGWTSRPATDTTNWFVFDDRGIYRPGETARLTGWVRTLGLSDGTGLGLPGPDATVAYSAADAQGNELAAGVLEPNRLGGFNLAIEIPAGANLGPSRVSFTLDDPTAIQLDGRSTSHAFQIQEFRRPEFEVTAQVETPAPHIAATPATVSVAAEYFSGGPLPDADVDWAVSTSDTTYRPPNWSEFSFGVWRPWWFAADDGFGDVALADECFDCGFGPIGVEVETYEGRTDGSGRHFLQIDFDASEADLPHSVSAQATVFDLNRQAWSASTNLLVHPATAYVGLRSDRPFVEQGTPIRVDAVVTDIDGSIVAGRPVVVTAGRVDWAYEAGRWTEVLVDESTCELLSTANAADGTMRCEFDTEVGGQYRVSAIVEDEAGDRSRSEISIWVNGGRGRPTRAVERESVTIVPDRETYRPGDVAELLIQGPWDNGHGLVTVTHRGIVLTEHIETENGSAVFELPIEEGWLPNVDVQVDLVGVAERTDDDGTPRPDLPPRPAFAVGTARLSVPPADRALTVTATPADAELTPGDTTSVTVAVADPDGLAVEGAGVALVVVDEAVLSLTGYQLRDPISAFYPAAWSRLRSQYLRETILLDRTDLFGEAGAGATARSADGDAAEMAAEESADVAGAGAPESQADGIDLRSDFDALAVYAPDATTGADGAVTIDVPLPDNLTRYRVMAVAVDGAERFGVGESAITARLPLQVRPSPPRFLNFGDRAELPVVVQNQSDRPLEVDVAIQVSNLALDGPAGTRVTVPAGDRVEVRFPVTTDRTGTARARIVAASGSFTDAASFAVPVYTPATAEAFATYGVIDDGATAQTVLAPTDVIPGFGGLEITSSATAVQALTDAVLYLVDYRYESADAYASRIMAIAALRDVLDAFDAEGLPAPAEIEAQVDADVRALAALQNGDGGFASWQRGAESRPWSSVQAAHALVLAAEAGYRVPDDTLARALDYVQLIEEYLPFDMPQRSRDAVVAYALHVRHRAGQPVSADAQVLFSTRGDELELDALAQIWPAITDGEIRDTIERRIGNSAVETAGAATFATGYTEDDFLIAPSNRRTDGIVLDALITETPESDLIAKVVNGLLAGQRQGRWNNVQENAFILLALDRYFETFEAVTPEFVARAWLGDTYVAESTFEGRTTERYNTLVPIDLLLDPPVADDGVDADDAGDENADDEVDPTRTLVLAKDGDGRLYYRLGLRYAPADLQLAARDEGFVVERRYEAVDDESEVTRDADGTWRIAAGATVRVTVTMVADARRTDVALIDPFAAGLEAINPALATSGSITADASTRPGWWWSWFEHQNLRDDRAEAFATFLSAGTYEYSYVARATTPGEFVVPPARAEQIYSPEVFGRSSTDRVVVG